MRDMQKAIVSDLLVSRVPGWLHHGVCVGADEEAHAIAKSLGLLLAGHPPKNSHRRSWKCTDFDQLYAAKDYIPRNHDIVDLTEELIAAPAADEGHSLRSGTWSTIRYARQKRKMVTIVYADGSLEFSP